MDKGFFGELFDLDHNGELDSLEKAMDLMAFNELMNELENSSDELDEDMMDEIESADLDYDELSSYG